MENSLRAKGSEGSMLHEIFYFFHPMLLIFCVQHPGFTVVGFRCEEIDDVLDPPLSGTRLGTTSWHAGLE